MMQFFQPWQFPPMGHRGATIALCLFLVLGSGGQALGESEVNTPKVVVSATRTEKSLQIAPASISVVDQEEIRRKGYTSLADILQDVPGVEVYDQSLAGAKRINIRGESGSRVLIMIDGQKITEQKSMDGAPLLIDPEIIERIEVIKGPASVLYGSEAIGGAINIITKKGGDRPVQGSATVTYDGSTDGFTQSLSVYGGKDGFHYRVTGSHSDQGNRDTPDGELEESGSQRKSGSGFLGYETDKISLGLGLDAFDSEVESPPTQVDGSDFNLNLPEWSRKKGSLFLDIKDLNPTIKKIHLDAFAQETQKDFEQEMALNMGPLGRYNSTINTSNQQKTYGANTQVDILAHPSHYLVGGYSFTRDTLDADAVTDFDYLGGRMLPPPPIGPAGPSEDPETTFHQAAIDTHAIFIQDEWILPRNFILTMGGRQTWVSSELEDTDDPSSTIGKVTDSHPVFSAGLTWSGIQDLTLRGLASQGYRFPDLNKLFTGSTHGGQTTLANPDLDPETSNNFEIGARFNNGAWDLDLTGFMSYAKDYITTQSVGGSTTVYQFANVDEAQTHGIEAHIAYTIIPFHLTPYVTGTWMRRKFEEPGFSTWDTNTPELAGRLGLRWQTEMKDREATLWADAWMRAATDADEEKSDGTQTQNPAWQTANLGLGCEFGRERQYQVSLNLNNIFDQSYRTAQNSLDEPGFHAVVRVGVAF